MPLDKEVKERMQRNVEQQLTYVFGFDLKSPVEDRLLQGLKELFAEKEQPQPQSEYAVSDAELLDDFHDFVRGWLEEKRAFILEAYVEEWNRRIALRQGAEPRRLWMIERRREYEQSL